MVKASELKELSVEELQSRYQDLSHQMYTLTNERKVARKMEKPHQKRECRKDRARVLTVLRQKTGLGT